MQARIVEETCRDGGVIVVQLSGRVDVETAEPFRKVCLNRLRGARVVFDFSQLSFVGSSGILPFLETLQSFAESNSHRFKLSGVGSEFRRVFAATPLQTIEIYETSQQAIGAYLNPSAAAAAAVIPAPIQAVREAQDSSSGREPPLSQGESEEGADRSDEQSLEPVADFLQFRSVPDDPVPQADESDDVDDLDARI